MKRRSTLDSATVRLALAVSIVIFVVLLGGGLYAAHRHDELRTVQTDIQWHAVQANNEAQRLSILAERYFSGDGSVELTTLQTRYASLMAELKNMRQGPYAGILLAHSDLDSRIRALEAELAGLGNHLQGFKRDDRAALQVVRDCLERTVLALTDAVSVAVRQMAGPYTAGYWGNVLNILYFSIILAAGGLVFLATIVIAENTKNRQLAERYKEAMAKADMANRAKSRMLANVSHELRTPLNAIIGFSDILRDQVFGALGNDRYREYSGFIRDSGTHLLMLVNDLLHYAKHDDEGVRMAFAPVALSGVLEEAVHQAKNETELPDVPVDLDTSLAPTVLADAAAVRRIAANLIANAIRHSPDGAKVEIAYTIRLEPRDSGERLVVQISDRGPGTTEEQAERLLRPFELLQSDSFVAGPDEGAGFGMALAYRLAEKHGDGVSLKQRDGGGTVASFSLPVLNGGRA